MEYLVKFLMDYYLYFLFIAVLLILALIGYIVDSTRTNKLKKELFKENEDRLESTPLVQSIDPNVKLGSTVNQVESAPKMVDTQNVTAPIQESAPIEQKVEEASPVQTVNPNK